MVLHILDTSSYLYAGNYRNSVIVRGVRENNGAYEENSAPIGGVEFLVRRCADLTKGDNVVIPVFDSTPTIKREMFEEAYGNIGGYKGTRKYDSKSEHMGDMRRYSYKLLEDVGYPVQIAEGYEADDIIYSLVQYYKNDFEEIYVHVRDSDLTFLVSDNVSIATVGNLGKNINLRNYESMAKTNEHTPYNIIHIRKVLAGDTVDNIPGVGEQWGPALDAVIDASELRNLGDLDLCRRYIKQAVLNNPDLPNAHSVLRTFDIVCPLLVPEHLLNDSEMEVDSAKLAYYLGGWDASLDRWHLEDMLAEYIDDYYE